MRLVVLSEPDPVARAVAERWGSYPSVGAHVEGAAVRRLSEQVWFVRRPVRHIHDERLDRLLPPAVLSRQPTIVFPSVHRSESGVRCLTVHPLGNAGPAAELGGRPRTFTPADGRTMAALLGVLAEGGPALGVPVTYEATHHGPELEVPACFAEIAVDASATVAEEQVGLLEQALRVAAQDPTDRVALAVGGGHYAPRFTDLARARRWAFGHILSRHALQTLDAATARQALDRTVGAEGVVFARAQDREHPALRGIGPELREVDAEKRRRSEVGPSGSTPRSSDT